MRRPRPGSPAPPPPDARRSARDLQPPRPDARRAARDLQPLPPRCPAPMHVGRRPDRHLETTRPAPRGRRPRVVPRSACGAMSSPLRPRPTPARRSAAFRSAPAASADVGPAVVWRRRLQTARPAPTEVGPAGVSWGGGAVRRRAGVGGRGSPAEVVPARGAGGPDLGTTALTCGNRVGGRTAGGDRQDLGRHAVPRALDVSRPASHPDARSGRQGKGGGLDSSVRLAYTASLRCPLTVRLAFLHGAGTRPVRGRAH